MDELTPVYTRVNAAANFDAYLPFYSSQALLPWFCLNHRTCPLYSQMSKCII